MSNVGKYQNHGSKMVLMKIIFQSPLNNLIDVWCCTKNLGPTKNYFWPPLDHGGLHPETPLRGFLIPQIRNIFTLQKIKFLLNQPHRAVSVIE